jgi:hypothetical protein
MDLILVSQANPTDASLHAALTPLLGNKTMVSVTPAQIAAVAANITVSEEHPIHIAAADPETEAALEDAAQSGLEGTLKLLKNKKTQKVTSAELAKAKAKAEQIGQEGEGLLDGYFAAKLAAGQLASYTWASAETAIAPFDFDTLTAAGERTLIDAKTTNGKFENLIHISLAEIIEASGTVTYRIYRVFELNDAGAKLRISDDIRPLAQLLKTLHEKHMPSGIRVDTSTIATDSLTWGPEEYVVWPEDEEAV